MHAKKMMKLRRLYLVLTTVLVLTSWLLLSAFQADVPWEDLAAVLAWVAMGGGAPFLVAWALAWAAENWPAWHTFPPFVKFFVPMVVSVVLAGIAQATLTYLPHIIAQVAPYWRFMVLAVIAWLGSQAAYMKAKAARYGSQYRTPAPGAGLGEG